MTTTSHTTKLLIVDDLPDNRLALEALIRKDDRVVYQAAGGDEALALLLDHEFALAILDVQMPGMNGFELAALMRGTEKTRDIPIVFVTAAGKELDYAFQGYETGAVDFLYKPLDGHAVRSKVNVFVRLHQQRREIERQMLALETVRREQRALLQELQTAHADLERAIRMRDDFMSMAAHELRTPLNTLFIGAQTRQLQADRHNSAFFALERITAMARRDVRQIRGMIRLIDDMLDVSRLRSGQLSIEPADVDLAELVRRVAGDFSHQADAAGCTVSLQAAGPVQGRWDAFRVEQILGNLLGNALRYGAGKPIAVTLTATVDSARLIVQDQGCGIAAGDRQRIFEKFERVGGPNGAHGLGLGLFITKQLVDAHGGSIEVDSEPGTGSTFVVTLPLRAARAPA